MQIKLLNLTKQFLGELKALPASTVLNLSSNSKFSVSPNLSDPYSAHLDFCNQFYGQLPERLKLVFQNSDILKNPTQTPTQNPGQNQTNTEAQDQDSLPNVSNLPFSVSDSELLSFKKMIAVNYCRMFPFKALKSSPQKSSQLITSFLKNFDKKELKSKNYLLPFSLKSYLEEHSESFQILNFSRSGFVLKVHSKKGDDHIFTFKTSDARKYQDQLRSIELFLNPKQRLERQDDQMLTQMQVRPDETNQSSRSTTSSNSNQSFNLNIDRLPSNDQSPTQPESSSDATQSSSQNPDQTSQSQGLQIDPEFEYPNSIDSINPTTTQIPDFNLTLPQESSIPLQPIDLQGQSLRDYFNRPAAIQSGSKPAGTQTPSGTSTGGSYGSQPSGGNTIQGSDLPSTVDQATRPNIPGLRGSSQKSGGSQPSQNFFARNKRGLVPLISLFGSICAIISL